MFASSVRQNKNRGHIGSMQSKTGLQNLNFEHYKQCLAGHISMHRGCVVPKLTNINRADSYITKCGFKNLSDVAIQGVASFKVWHNDVLVTQLWVNII